MNIKVNNVLSKLNCILLSAIIILSSSIPINALEMPKNDITYTCYNKDNGISGFYYVIEDDGRKEIIYCYNGDLTEPSASGTSGYKKYDYFSSDIDTISTEVKSEIAAILYAGYPNDALGFMEEFGVSEDEARRFTQDAIWSLTRGNHHSNISRNTYLHALYYYAEINKESYGDTGNVSIDDNIVLTQENGVWKSNNLNVSGDYTGSISFSDLPENISVYDAKTNKEINSSFKVGDSIYIVYSGDIKEKFSETLTYTYDTTDVILYKSPDVKRQDMIRAEIVSNKKNITISAENTNKELPSKITNTNVIINKVEEGTEKKVIGASLKLYEGNPDNGNLIKEWITTEESMKIKVEVGKTYTLVEESAPEGYEIAEPITFTVGNNASDSEYIKIIEDTTDYVGYRYDGEKYITDGKNKGVVYCINQDLANPEVVLNPTFPSLDDKNYPHYRHWILSSVNDELLYKNQKVKFTREELAELLLAGYPTDYYGYKEKHNLSNSQAYSRTQAVLDAVLRGDTGLKDTSGLSGEYLDLTNYYNDLVNAFLNPKIANSTSVVDFFNWIDGTGKEGKVYQNLVGITPFENNITIEVTMEDPKSTEEPELPGIGGTTPELPGEEGDSSLPGEGGEAGKPEQPGIGGTTPELPGEEGDSSLPGEGGEAGKPEQPGIGGTTPELPGEEGDSSLPGEGGEAGKPEQPGIGGTTPELPGEEGDSSLPGEGGEAGKPEQPGIGGTIPELPGEDGEAGKPEQPGIGGTTPELPGEEAGKLENQDSENTNSSTSYPKTGDAGIVGFVILALVSLSGLYINKKKKSSY